MDFYRYPDPLRSFEVGAQGYVVVRRTRKWLGWLRHVPGLRRFATSNKVEVYPVTMTAVSDDSCDIEVDREP